MSRTKSLAPGGSPDSCQAGWRGPQRAACRSWARCTAPPSAAGCAPAGRSRCSLLHSATEATSTASRSASTTGATTHLGEAMLCPPHPTTLSVLVF
eukprot:358377-Chlamydomonas_euryale.AAC.1